MFEKKFKPEEVFTPKGSVVNTDMYIERPELETALEKAIRKPKHIIIHGESGSGKTWLYKNLFKKFDIKYEVLNAATVITSGSIINAIISILSKLNPVKCTGYDEKKAATVSALFLESEIDHTNKYESQSPDPFLDLMKVLGDESKNKESFLVIENVEHLLDNQNYLKEISALLLYLDDEQYSKYNVRILIVGTPTNIRDYFASLYNGQTIINRVQEIPEVSVLSRNQTSALSKKGLIDKLKYYVENEYLNSDGTLVKYGKDRLFSHISWFTADVPQYIHELCLELSLDAEKNNNLITCSLFYDSLFDWLKCSLVSEHSKLEHNVNSVETKHGRKNQVIFAMALILQHEFNYQEIEAEVRRHFPISTQGKKLNVSGVLSELSKGQYAIIRKVPKGTRYRFIDPRIKIIARWMLTKQDEGSEILTVTKFDETIHMF